MMKRIGVNTHSRQEFVEITAEVQRAVAELDITDGAAVIYCPHTTAGLTINENADPDVVRDMLDVLERLVPCDAGYRHCEGNADSHVKASLMGSSVTVPLEGGSMALGTWQGVYLCEFDGPRSRNVLVAAYTP
jgi:secondary thiamine-phosphate synthase enzyme